MSIFVSHSSKDKEIVDGFLQNILIKGIGVSPSDIFCTSIQGMDIKSGEDFKKTIKDELSSADVIIQIISDNYKESEVCLNEMGASWVLDATVIPFILPPVSFSNVGFIHNTTQLLRLNEGDDLKKFRDDHAEGIGSSNIPDSDFNKCIESFFNVLSPFQKAITTKAKTRLPENVFNEYFSLFLDSNINHYNLMIKAQPNLADCKAVFRDEVYEDVYNIYSILYRGILLKTESWENVYTKDFFDYDSIVFDGHGFTNERIATVGIKREEITKLIKPNTTFYSIHFKNTGAEYGVAYNSWAYVNGRWVFFPKPWKFLRLMQGVKESKLARVIYRWLKFAGLHKDLKGDNLELEFLIAHIINKLKNT